MQKISSQYKVSNVRPNLYNISEVEMGGKENVSSTLRTMILEEEVRDDFNFPTPSPKKLRSKESDVIGPSSEPLVVHQDTTTKEKLAKEEKDLLRILEDLEEVRHNLRDSSGQGFLINASATISSFIRNTYRQTPLPRKKP